MNLGRIVAVLAGLAGAATDLAACSPPAAGAAGPGETAEGCRPDLRLLLGACVEARVAAQACGPTAIASPGGCLAKPRCEPGRARDLQTGACVGALDVRALASSLGILVGEDEVLGCPGEDELVSADLDPGAPRPRLGCLARPSTAADPPCPRGWVAGDAPGACARVREPGRRGDEPRVDVVRWLRAAVGSDGGAGAPPLCRALARSPAALGAGPGRIAVSLAFPDNDVTQVVASVRDAGGAPEAALELERILGPRIEALRSLGGIASQASVSVAVRCDPGRASSRPVPVPQIR